MREYAPTRTLTVAPLGAIHGNKCKGRNAMPAQVISLCDYRKKKGARKRSRDEKGSDKADVVHIGTFKANKSLKGRGFPDDFFFGPDDAPEDFGLSGLFSGLSGMNLSLDNPNFPYEPEDDKE